jgi:hypothetical protein
MLESQNKEKLIFLCYYLEPFIDENDPEIIKTRWQSKYISFDDLKFDYTNYKLFYYDRKAKDKELRDYINNRPIIEFEKFWLEQSGLTSEEKHNKLLHLENLFESKKVNFNISDLRETGKLYPILNGLYSLKHRKIINYGFTNFLALANHILEYRKEYGEIFLLALRHYNYEKDLLLADKKGTYRKKIHKSLNSEQDRTYNKLFKILFPELEI